MEMGNGKGVEKQRDVLPWGPSLEMFKNPLEERFVHPPDDFFKAGRSIGGHTVHYGDAGVTFQALPRDPVLFILWAADEEFPTRVTILFDLTIEDHLALDTIWGLTRVATLKCLEF